MIKQLQIIELKVQKKKTSLYEFFNDKKNSLQNLLGIKKDNNKTNVNNNNNKTNINSNNNNKKVSTKMFADTPKKKHNPLFPEQFEDLPDEFQLYKNSLNLKERKLNDLKNIIIKYKDIMNSEDYENSIEMLEFFKKNL